MQSIVNCHLNECGLVRFQEIILSWFLFMQYDEQPQGDTTGSLQWWQVVDPSRQRINLERVYVCNVDGGISGNWDMFVICCCFIYHLGKCCMRVREIRISCWWWNHKCAHNLLSVITCNHSSGFGINSHQWHTLFTINKELVNFNPYCLIMMFHSFACSHTELVLKFLT